MATNPMPGADVGGFADQFKGLDFKRPGQWALGPKLVAWALTAAAVVAIGYALLLSASHDELDAERGKEPTLKADYRNKLGQAVNLAELQKQKLQVEEYVTQLEKQLPGKAEMDALLSDINQAGLGRGLQFELFRPGSVVVKDFYAELPISIKVAGKYHDIGAFTADIANLSRIVTLHDVTISAGADKKETTNLVMDATARTYRYLDQAEIKAVKDANAPKAAGAKK
jgi:type IV pilus assembly protein PilO